MALTRLRKGPWHLITGTGAEVLQELADAGIKPHNIGSIADDATSATFMKGK